MLPLVTGLVLLAQKPLTIKPPTERFQYESPLTSISGEMMDDYNDGQGLAQQRARADRLQARIMWIDGTANLDRVNSEDKIVALTKRIAKAGFNTIVFDIKPISGQTLYKSDFAPKIESWRGQTLPLDFDPLPIMVREAHLNHLMLLTSLNAFSEGHNLMHEGPGFSQPSLQSVLYNAVPVLKTNSGKQLPLDSILNPGRSQTAGEAQLFNNPTQARAFAPHFAALLAADGTVLSVAENGIPEGFKTGERIVCFDQADALEPGVQTGIDSEAEYVRAADHPDQYPLMMDPLSPDVQQRMLAIVNEVVSKYKVDGLLFDDRLRYAGMDAEFSAATQSQFETYVGEKLTWPDDVFKVTYSPVLHKGLKPGRFYDAWMVWRALQMRNWVARVQRTVKSARQTALFGIYGGSWYGDYPALGSNYGAPSLEAGFEFLTPTYQETGFANLLDFFISGCYYTTPTIYDAMGEGKPIGSTVEAAGQLSNRVVDDQCWTVAGISLESFAGNPVGLKNVLQAACASTQGVMVFDLSHNIEPMWPTFERAFHFAARSPLAYPGELKKVRKLRKHYQQLGAHERPVPILSGTSGTGF